MDKSEWLEQTLVTRVYLSGKYPQSQGKEGIKDMETVLNGWLDSLQTDLFRSKEKSDITLVQ